MSTDLPGPDGLRDLADRLKGKDIGWFRERYRSGDLEWAKDRLPAGEYDEMGHRLDAGDLDWVSGRLGSLDLPGGGLTGLGASGLGAAGGALGAVGGAAAGLAGKAGDAAGSAKDALGGLTSKAGDAAGAAKSAAGDALGGLTSKAGDAAGAAKGAAGSVAGAAGSAVRGVTGTAAGMAGGAAGMAGGAVRAGADGARKKGWLWLIPVVIVAALLALALTQCGGDDDDEAVTTAGSSVATETTAATTETTAAATETTAGAAAASETTAAATETTAATTETTAAATETTAPVAAAAGDLLASAGVNGNLTTFLQAVDAAGLGETLKGTGPFTVFAPTDDAFKAVPAELLSSLLANKEALAKVLSYHVVPGSLKAADLQAGELPSVGGDPLTIAIDGTTVKVNDATVLSADGGATNGVIHTIDKVLVPGGDLNALLAAAPPSSVPDTAPATTNAAGDSTPEGLTVYFGNGSAALDGAAQAKIAGAVETLKGLAAGSKVAIVGHASKTGNPAANQRLSEKRAANVLAALQAGLGADASKLTFATAAKGDTETVADESKSRRVTIEIAS